MRINDYRVIRRLISLRSPAVMSVSINHQLCDQKAGWRSLSIILVMALIAIFVYVYVAPKMPLFFDDVGFLEPYEPKIEEPGRFLYLAKQGNAKAQFFLGAMYMAGIGVPQDNTKAAKWLRKAGAQHNSDIHSTCKRPSGSERQRTRATRLPSGRSVTCTWWARASRRTTLKQENGFVRLRPGQLVCPILSRRPVLCW